MSPLPILAWPGLRPTNLNSRVGPSLLHLTSLPLTLPSWPHVKVLLAAREQLSGFLSRASLRIPHQRILSTTTSLSHQLSILGSTNIQQHAIKPAIPPKPIHPYVKQDLRESEIVDIYPWVEAAFGVPRHRIDEWTSKIGELKWFDDKVIQRSLKDFCAAEIEPAERYESFCNLANRIISLARGNIPHIPKTHSYPVDSITFVADSNAVASIPEHGETGAIRYLDVTVTHGKAYGRILRGGQIAWADVLHTVKLKRTNLPLSDVLEDEKKKRKAAARQPVPAKVRLLFTLLLCRAYRIA